MQALEFFRSKRTDADKEKISGIQTIEVLLSRMLFTMDYTEDLSKNFRSVVDSVGQHAAGDEKLFDKCGEWKSLKNIDRKPKTVKYFEKMIDFEQIVFSVCNKNDFNRLRY